MSSDSEWGLPWLWINISFDIVSLNASPSTPSFSFGNPYYWPVPATVITTRSSFHLWRLNPMAFPLLEHTDLKYVGKRLHFYNRNSNTKKKLRKNNPQSSSRKSYCAQRQWSVIWPSFNWQVGAIQGWRTYRVHPLRFKKFLWTTYFGPLSTHQQKFLRIFPLNSSELMTIHNIQQMKHKFTCHIGYR